MSDLNQFRIDLDRAFHDKVETRVAQATRWVALEALRRVIFKSPVRDGRFRGNWQASVGVRPDGTLEIDDTDGNPTFSAGTQAIATMPPYSVVYLVNNLDYAEALENGHSQQAPAGVVAVTVAEIEAFFNNIPPEAGIPETVG